MEQFIQIRNSFFQPGQMQPEKKGSDEGRDSDVCGGGGDGRVEHEGVWAGSFQLLLLTSVTLQLIQVTMNTNYAMQTHRSGYLNGIALNAPVQFRPKI
jgi:hypothetical protein